MTVLYYVCYAIVAVAVFEKVLEPKHDESMSELFKPKEAEEYVQLTNIVHKESKNRDLKAHLMATWGVDETVAVEIEKLVEHVMTDFIHVWFDLSKFYERCTVSHRYVLMNSCCLCMSCLITVSDDGDFVWVIREVLGNVFGLIVQRGQSRVDPIAFVCDKIANILTRSLRLYRSAKEELMKSNPELFNATPVVSEDWKKLQLALADEFRRKGRLHGMFGLRVPRAAAGGGGGGEAAAASTAGSGSVRLPISIGQEMRPDLTPEEFFDESRLHACEARYLRHISTLIFPILMCNDGERNCKVIKSLLKEVVAQSVLQPIFALFVPSTMNYWLAIPRGCEIVDELAKSGQIDAAAEAEAAAGSSITYLETDQMEMMRTDAYPVAVAPEGFSADVHWRHLGGMIGIDEAELLLVGKPEGTFLMRCMEMPGYYSISFVQAPHTVDGADTADTAPEAALTGTDDGDDDDDDDDDDDGDSNCNGTESKRTRSPVSHVLVLATAPSTFELVVMDMDTDKYPEDVCAGSLSEFMQKISVFARYGIEFDRDEDGMRAPRAVVQYSGGESLGLVRDGSGGHVDLTGPVVFTPLDHDSSDEEGLADGGGGGGGDPQALPAPTAGGSDTPSAADIEFDDSVTPPEIEASTRATARSTPRPISTPSPTMDRNSWVGHTAHSTNSVDDEFRFSAERMYLLGEMSGAVDEFVTTYEYFHAKSAEAGAMMAGSCVEISDDRGCHSVGRLLTILETILCYGCAEYTPSGAETECVGGSSSGLGDEFASAPAGSATLYDYFRDISAMLLSGDEDSCNLEEMLVGVQMGLDAVSLALSAEDVRNNPLMFAVNPSIGHSGAQIPSTCAADDAWGTDRAMSRDSQSSAGLHDELEAMELKAWEITAFHRNRLRALIYHLLATGCLITCLEDMLADVQSFHQNNAAALAERYWLPHSFAFSGGGKSLQEVIAVCFPLVGKTVVLREKSRGRPAAPDGGGTEVKDAGSDAGGTGTGTGSPRRPPRPLSQKMAAGAMNFITMPVKMLNTTVSTVRNAANNVSSRFDFDSDPAVPGNENDSFLVFGRNADMVDVSRMRRDLADKEWGRRRGSVQYSAVKEGSALDADSLTESEQESLGGSLINPFASTRRETVVLTDYQKKAEKVFKLSMLLRDRPAVEVLASRNMWLPSPMKLTASITLVEKRESKSALNPLGSTILLYKIAVEMTRSCEFHGVGDDAVLAAAGTGAGAGASDEIIARGSGGGGNAPLRSDIVGSAGGPLSEAIAKRDAKLKQTVAPKDTDRDQFNYDYNLVESWLVERRYSDFEELAKVLKSSAGSVMSSRHISLPPKHNISGQWSSSFMEKRKQKLQGYMDDVLTTFAVSEEIRVFLSPLGTGEMGMDSDPSRITSRLVPVRRGRPVSALCRSVAGPLIRSGGSNTNSSSVTGAIGGAASNMLSGVRNSLYGDLDSIKADLAEVNAMAKTNANAAASASANTEAAASGRESPKPAGTDAASTALSAAGFSEYTTPAKMKLTEFTHIDNLLQKKLSVQDPGVRSPERSESASRLSNSNISDVPSLPGSPGGVGTSVNVNPSGVPVSPKGKPKIQPAMDAGKVDMAILDKRLYPLLKELLDAGKMGAIRRNILVVILSSAKMLFSTEISKWMSEQSKDAVSHRTTAVTLEYIRGCVWPNGKLIAAGKVQSPEQDAIMRERNKIFLAEKLKNSYVGNIQVR